MSAMTTRRIVLVALATAGLAFFAGLLLSGSNNSATDAAGNAGPIGASLMVVFATACAVSAAWAAHGGQRLAWIGMCVGLAGWAAGNAVWCYVAAGGTAPISNSSAATLGYLILPICALAATIMVPLRGDSRFGIGLLLDGIVVAASLFLALGSLVLGPADTGERLPPPLGGDDSGLPRARRDCGNRRARNRARPQQPFDVAIVRGVRHHRCSRITTRCAGQGRPTAGRRGDARLDLRHIPSGFIGAHVPGRTRP